MSVHWWNPASDGGLDRLLDKFIIGKTQRCREEYTHTLSSNTPTQDTHRHAAPHRWRQSNTQQAAFTSRQKEVEGWKWKDGGKSAEILLPMLSTPLQVVSLLLTSLDLYPTRCFLQGYATVSSSFHLYPLKLRKAFRHVTDRWRLSESQRKQKVSQVVF